MALAEDEAAGVEDRAVESTIESGDEAGFRAVSGTNFFLPGKRTRSFPRSGLATPCLPSSGCGGGIGAALTAMLRAAVALAPCGSVTRTPSV